MKATGIEMSSCVMILLILAANVNACIVASIKKPTIWPVHGLSVYCSQKAVMTKNYNKKKT